MISKLDKIMTPEELAERWGVTTNTLAVWRHHGEGPVFVKIGGRVRYHENDVISYELTRRTKKTKNEK